MAAVPNNFDLFWHYNFQKIINTRLLLPRNKLFVSDLEQAINRYFALVYTDDNGSPPYIVNWGCKDIPEIYFDIIDVYDV